MVSAVREIPAVPPRTGLLDWGRRLLARSEAARAYLLLSPTLLVVLCMMILPLVGLVVLSLWTPVGFKYDTAATLNNYWTIFEPSSEPQDFPGFFFLGIPFYLETPIYLALLVKSLVMSFLATVVVVLLAYPMAYFLAFRVKRHKLIWLILITVPFWTSYLLRVFAWKIILGFNGVVNASLIGLNIITEPLEFLLYSPVAVTITLAHAWAAFAILPIYVSLEKIDRSLLEAATDLGDGPVRRFLRVTLPLSMPGTVAASLIVFIPTVGDYVTPQLVGGTNGIMIGNIIQSLFGKANNWPLGAAVGIVTMLVITLVVCLFLWGTGRRGRREATA
jgi:spermidine/putrescine transport system permease protein